MERSIFWALRFWNATDACCNFFGSNVDDSGYLRNLIDEIARQLNVNARRIHIMGHSNGGFMAYRMACDHADLLGSIISLAGASFEDPSRCGPSGPVHTLQIHGTADTVVLYNGGDFFGQIYPSAVGSAQRWATYDGCTLDRDDSSPPFGSRRGNPGRRNDRVALGEPVQRGRLGPALDYPRWRPFTVPLRLVRPHDDRVPLLASEAWTMDRSREWARWDPTVFPPQSAPDPSRPTALWP